MLSSLSQRFAGGAGNATETFDYNPASQITTHAKDNDAYIFTGDANVSRTYGVNGLNQYTAAGPASFTYDANGNLTGDGANSYTYDVENRLIGVSGARTASLIYDPLGRLFETSNAPLNSGGTITRFVYDGDALWTCNGRLIGCPGHCAPDHSPRPASAAQSSPKRCRSVLVDPSMLTSSPARSLNHKISTMGIVNVNTT